MRDVPIHGGHEFGHAGEQVSAQWFRGQIAEELVRHTLRCQQNDLRTLRQPHGGALGSRKLGRLCGLGGKLAIHEQLEWPRHQLDVSVIGHPQLSAKISPPIRGVMRLVSGESPGENA